MFVLLLLIALFIAYGILEWNNHIKNLSRIPIRIIVNGTRGKSTVTRLIGAGLRGGGYKVIAKTTGTKPRIVFNNEKEIPIIRLGRANIREQVKIIRFASKNKVKAVVLENMSIRPDLQFVEENIIIKPQIVVITNVRNDHLDVMGPTLKDVATAFVNAVPKNATIITGERELFSIICELAKKRGIEVIGSSEDEVTNEEMTRFQYVEHKENVALALKVCQYLGINRQNALNEMYKYIPDPGVLRKYNLKFSEKRVTIYNAMAANDPDSTFLIFQRIQREPNQPFYILMNCRSDRIDRSKQMAKLTSSKIPALLYFVTGGSTFVFVNYAVKFGIPREKIIDLGGKTFEEIYNAISTFIEDNSVILAIGNIVGYGEELLRFLVEKGS